MFSWRNEEVKEIHVEIGVSFYLATVWQTGNKGSQITGEVTGKRLVWSLYAKDFSHDWELLMPWWIWICCASCTLKFMLGCLIKSQSQSLSVLKSHYKGMKEIQVSFGAASFSCTSDCNSEPALLWKSTFPLHPSENKIRLPRSNFTQLLMPSENVPFSLVMVKFHLS